MQRDAAQAAPAKPTLERPTFDTKPKPPHNPPRATAMRLLSGSGSAGGHALTLGTKYPVSALGEDVQLQGFWQAGTKI